VAGSQKQVLHFHDHCFQYRGHNVFFAKYDIVTAVSTAEDLNLLECYAVSNVLKDRGNFIIRLKQTENRTDPEDDGTTRLQNVCNDLPIDTV
jgi:hypothetical protein